MNLKSVKFYSHVPVPTNSGIPKTGTKDYLESTDSLEIILSQGEVTLTCGENTVNVPYHSIIWYVEA